LQIHTHLLRSYPITGYDMGDDTLTWVMSGMYGLYNAFTINASPDPEVQSGITWSCTRVYMSTVEITDRGEFPDNLCGGCVIAPTPTPVSNVLLSCNDFSEANWDCTEIDSQTVQLDKVSNQQNNIGFDLVNLANDATLFFDVDVSGNVHADLGYCSTLELVLRLGTFDIVTYNSGECLIDWNVQENYQASGAFTADEGIDIQDVCNKTPDNICYVNADISIRVSTIGNIYVDEGCIPVTPVSSGGNPASAYCQSIMGDGDELSPWRVLVGNVRRQDCFTIPEIDPLAILDGLSVLLDTIPFFGLVIDALIVIAENAELDVVLQETLVCVKQQDFDLYYWNIRIPLGDFLAVFLLLAGARAWGFPVGSSGYGKGGASVEAITNIKPSLPFAP